MADTGILSEEELTAITVAFDERRFQRSGDNEFRKVLDHIGGLNEMIASLTAQLEKTRGEALEEAAKVAERHDSDSSPCNTVARAIRSLQTKD
jgi:hypothetical protein